MYLAGVALLSLAGTNPLEAPEPEELEEEGLVEVAARAAATASAIVGCRAEITEPTIAASFCLLWIPLCPTLFLTHRAELSPWC